MDNVSLCWKAGNPSPVGQLLVQQPVIPEFREEGADGTKGRKPLSLYSSTPLLLGWGWVSPLKGLIVQRTKAKQEESAIIMSEERNLRSTPQVHLTPAWSISCLLKGIILVLLIPRSVRAAWKAITKRLPARLPLILLEQDTAPGNKVQKHDSPKRNSTMG